MTPRWRSRSKPAPGRSRQPCRPTANCDACTRTCGDATAGCAALLPDVTLPAQAVGGYALNEIQVSWQPDPLARPGDRVLRRYRLAADNLQGAALTEVTGWMASTL